MSYNTQHHYKIALNLTVDGETSSKETDINYCCFLRTPIAKIATICIIYSHIPQDIVDRWIEALSEHDFEKNLQVLVTITMHNALENHEPDIEGNPIFSRKYVCLGIEPVESQRNVDNDIPCRMVLVNKMLHSMYVRDAYNVALDSLTSSAALEQFEQWVTTEYGDFVNFQKIGTKEQQSDFVYEQIFVKTNNDLVVPNYLINAYKTHEIYTPYFWDDFVISDDNIAHKEVCAWHINFNNVDALKEVDVTKQGDTLHLVTHTGDVSHSDIFKYIHVDSNTIVHSLPNHVMSKTSPETSQITKKDPIKTETINVADNRIKMATLDNSDVYTQPFDTSVMSTSCYTPDDEDHADMRLEQSKAMMEKVDRFATFEIGPCFPDFPQFGEKYNLNYHKYEEARKEFKFTPLNICNIFMRKGAKETYLSHYAKVLMIQYKPETG